MLVVAKANAYDKMDKLLGSLNFLFVLCPFNNRQDDLFVLICTFK